MMLEIFYNFPFFILLFLSIISISFYLKNFCHCFKKEFLGYLILTIGLFFSFTLPFYIGQYLISLKISELNSRFTEYSYQLIIYPKSYPYEDQIKIAVKSKKNDKYLSIILKDKNFNIDNILEQIKPNKDKIDSIFKE